MASPEKTARRRGPRRGHLVAGVLSATLVVTGLFASPAFANEDYATWDEVVAAQDDVARQQALIADIQDQIAGLDQRVAEADAASRAAGEQYGTAMEASQNKAAEVATLQQEASDAEAVAQASAEQAGRLAATMANRSGGDPALTLLNRPSEADDLLYQLGTISKLSEQTDGIYQDAIAQQNTATALGEQAETALGELKTLEADAKTKFDAAQGTQIALLNQKNAADAQRAELQAMLVPLQQQRDVTTADYEAGQQYRQEQLEQENADRAAAAQQAQRDAYAEAVAEAERAGVAPPPEPDYAATPPPVVVPTDAQTNPDGTLARPDQSGQSTGAGDGSTGEAGQTPVPQPSTDPGTEPSVDPSTDPSTEPSPEPSVDPVVPEPVPSVDPYVPPEKPDIEVVPEPEPQPDPAPDTNTGILPGYAAPIANGVVTDEYGMRLHPISGDYRMHNGLDLGVNGGTCGAPLMSVHSGVVTYAGYNGGFGYHVVVDIGGGVEVSYSHIMEGGINVWVGQWINPGDVIAYAGTTGSSTGCHLHFELKYYGQLMDPKPWLASAGIYYY